MIKREYIPESMLASRKIRRLFSPLLAINDHYPKYVVTMDNLWQDNIEGIRHKHIVDFLLEDWR